MGRNNNPTRGSTIRHVVRTIAAGVAAAATLAAGMLVAGTADAADMRDPFERSIQNGNPGLWANLGTITFSNGHKYEDMEQSLGVVDKVNGRNVYCIQADTLYTGTAGTWGEWTDAKTKPDAQRLAWLEHGRPHAGRDRGPHPPEARPDGRRIPAGHPTPRLERRHQLGHVHEEDERVVE